MKRVGVVGLGDMGAGLAKNLIAAGFETTGFDLDAARLAAFEAGGGKRAASVAEVGAAADVVFVMVLNGTQAKAVILGDGLAATMASGGVVVLTATIKASEVREIAVALDGTGIALVDAPVSGGRPGAEGGTLTLMAAADDAVLDAIQPVLDAISKTVHRVGSEPGLGQTVKTCLQTLIGGIFSATYETAALAAKAGVSGQVLYDVVSSTGAGCGITNGSLTNIIDRKLTNTGSHINTMHKDLTIVVDLARELGVPLFTAATALQLFSAARARYPDGDNQVVARLLEDIVGAELKR